MKTSFILGFLIFLTSPFSFAGKEGGGGIIIAAEFAITGRSALEILGMGDSGLDMTSILNQIKDTKVIPVEDICYTDPVLNKQYCEDAHYDKQNNVILLNFKKWDLFTCKEKLILATHEFLRAAELEGEDYTFSGRFLTGNLNQCSGQGGTPQQQYDCADLSVQISSRVTDLCNRLSEFALARKNP